MKGYNPLISMIISQTIKDILIAYEEMKAREKSSHAKTVFFDSQFFLRLRKWCQNTEALHWCTFCTTCQISTYILFNDNKYTLKTKKYYQLSTHQYIDETRIIRVIGVSFLQFFCI